MARTRYKPEEIVAKLRQVDVLTSQGQTLADAIRQNVVRCAGKTFIHLILNDSNDDAPQFLSMNEDPVVVTLTDEERGRFAMTAAAAVLSGG